MHSVKNNTHQLSIILTEDGTAIRREDYADVVYKGLQQFENQFVKFFNKKNGRKPSFFRAKLTKSSLPP